MAHGCADVHVHRSTRRPSPPTRCTSARGGATPKVACSATRRSPSHSRRIAARWASRTSSCCRSWSIPSVAPGAIRSPVTTRPRRGTAVRTTSAGSWMSCIATASVCCSTGCPRISLETAGHSHALTARRSTSMEIHAAASTRTGGRMSSTTDATRCATSSSRTPITGPRNSTSTVCAWTRWRRCCISTTRGNRAPGCRTSMVARRISRRSPCCATSTTRCTRAMRV